MLQICFLGQPRFAVDGGAFKFSAPPKTLPLLAYLLLNRWAPLARDAVAFTLWPDDTEEAARTDFRRHLNYLKNALPASPNGQPWVVADGDAVQWNLAAQWWFDVAEFERLAGPGADRAKAVELYAGDLLENLYDDWLFGPRERLRNLYIACLSDLLLESRSRRDFSQAIAWAQRILGADPWREDTVRQLMTARYEAGDRAGALREFERFQRRLHDEMDVDPMPETAALRETVARNAPVAELQLVDRSAATEERPRAPSLPFIGRESEIDQLRALWSRAARGRGGVALICGEAGIGKTRLASELALLVGAQGGRLLVGGTLHPESLPYEPIAEALRSAMAMLSALDAPPAALAALAQIVPELRARRADLPQLPALDPNRERMRLFDAIAAGLQSFAKPRPVLLVLEDLHWAGEATLSALEFLARRVGSLSVFIVGTYRDEEAEPGHPLRDIRRRLQRENLAGHVELSRLSASAVSDLVAHVPELAARDRAATIAFARSEGNPLFLGEVIRDLLETGDSPPAAVPRGLLDTIQARLARLPEPARFVSQVAAVIGSVFDVDVVSEVSGWPEHQVLDAIEPLVSRHIVRETGRRAAFDYAFTHHLIQAAIYDAVEPDGRARWHRRAARAMESIYAERGDEIAAVLARHYDEARETAHAAHYYLKAARHAMGVYANEEALALAGHGLDCSRDPVERYELLALRESLYHRLGRRREQRAALDELEQGATALGDDARACDVLSRRVALHRALGERDVEAGYVAQLTERAEQTGLPGWRGRAALANAWYSTNIGAMARARDALAVALTMFRTENNAPGEIEALCLLAYVDALQSKAEAAMRGLERAQTAAVATGNQALLAHSLYTASTAAVMTLDYQNGQRFAQRALELFRAIGDRDGEADCCARLGMASARRFEIVAAREWYASAQRLYAGLGKKQGQAATLLNSALLEFMIGFVQRSMALSAEAQRLFAELEDMRGALVSVLNVGMAHYGAAEYAQAATSARRAIDLAKKIGSANLEAAALGNLGAAERELGELPAAIDHLQASLELRRRAGAHQDSTLDRAELAIAYARAGKKQAAREAADQLMALDPRSYELTFAPQMVPWAASLAYGAAGSSKLAKEALGRARVMLETRMALLPDAETRAAYEAVWFNRELLAALKGRRKSRP